MELVTYLIVVLILLVSNLFFYKFGYRKGARRVLKEWKTVNDYFEEDD